MIWIERRSNQLLSHIQNQVKDHCFRLVVTLEMMRWVSMGQTHSISMVRLLALVIRVEINYRWHWRFFSRETGVNIQLIFWEICVILAMVSSQPQFPGTSSVYGYTWQLFCMAIYDSLGHFLDSLLIFMICDINFIINPF